MRSEGLRLIKCKIEGLAHIGCEMHFASLYSVQKSSLFTTVSREPRQAAQPRPIIFRQPLPVDPVSRDMYSCTYASKDMAMPSKTERARIFADRMRDAEPCSTFDEAFSQLAEILTDTEDEFTQVPCNPELWATDGRLYPPKEDNRFPTQHPLVTRYRNARHNTYIAANGAIKIMLGDSVWLDKPGADGITITSLMASIESTR